MARPQAAQQAPAVGPVVVPNFRGDVHKFVVTIASSSRPGLTFDVSVFTDNRVDFCPCESFKYQKLPLALRKPCKHLKGIYNAIDNGTMQLAAD